jgi:hypothetical protein
MMAGLIAATVTFLGLFIAVPIVLGFVRLLGLYTVVHERRCHVYVMFVSDPVAYLFRNADPRGSLAANVSNSTVRCLSNMPLAEMLVNRHPMSNTVRAEVSPQSHEWGYKLGSAYIRKVHFRDTGMIKQIESKVVNRLRQVTCAIKQDGANQVNIITSTAERQAAIEFAKAAAIRPEIVGATLQRISEEPELASVMFDSGMPANHRRRGTDHAAAEGTRPAGATSGDDSQAASALTPGVMKRRGVACLRHEPVFGSSRQLL